MYAPAALVMQRHIHTVNRGPMPFGSQVERATDPS